jgi:hypothetical protein
VNLEAKVKECGHESIVSGLRNERRNVRIRLEEQIEDVDGGQK